MNPHQIEAVRRRMVVEQLEKRGISDPRVLEALQRVPRERYIQHVSQADAYADRAWSIGCGQTISQPYIVALMTQALELSGSEHVLEIGTGSGFQTAVLAELAHDVVSIERFAELSTEASQTLAAEGYKNVKLVVGDGTLGWPEDAPYDRIIVTAASRETPPPLWEQLNEDGILVIPLGEHEGQVLRALRKRQGRPAETNLSPCRFVPLVGAQGWPVDEDAPPE
ncbi:MAG: protein-L-isoaspartate(D-aspartate) O-methyltransferase [Pirellulales bacterium]